MIIANDDDNGYIICVIIMILIIMKIKQYVLRKSDSLVPISTKMYMFYPQIINDCPILLLQNARAPI